MEKIIILLNQAKALLDLEGNQTKAVKQLDSIIANLDTKSEIQWPLNGAYLSVESKTKVNFRLDKSQSKVISGDVFKVTENEESYLFSFRSYDLSTFPTILIVAEDAANQTAKGQLVFTSTQKLTFQALLSLETKIAETKEVLIKAERFSTKYRKIGLEEDYEEGTNKEPVYLEDDKKFTIHGSLKKAGFQIAKVGKRNEIPNLASGWDTSQLHGLMTQFAQQKLDRPSWNLHVLQLRKSSMRGLLGVMFDSGNQDLNNLPRQGVAIFQDPMKSYRDLERKLIQTTVHEVGHALNLAHRFERVVGRAASNSFMNYDWKYKGGGKSKEFWKAFKFTFDKDEKAFLRHGRPFQVMPGGDAFHSVPYWENLGEGFVPYRPEEQSDEFSLELLPPPAGTQFSFGQPILLGFRLTNLSDDTIRVPEFMLDPKSGFLSFEVIKEGDEETNQSVFEPLFHRNYAFDAFAEDVLKPGESASNNVNLTFGAAGFTFAQPGKYEVRGTFSYGKGNRSFVVSSEKLPISVLGPNELAEEQEVIALMRPEVGLYWALGGSDQLHRAQGVLDQVADARSKRSKGKPDAVLAHLKRATAFMHQRDVVTYQDGLYEIKKGNFDQGQSMLAQLQKDKWLQNFDPETGKAMKA